MSVEIVSAPTEAENYLYALLQDESGIDLAEFCYIDERNQEGGGIFRAYPFQVPWYRDKSKLHVDAAGRCIMEGQLVLTSTGWVPIQYVRVGDLVLTHMNRWRPVTHVWDRGLKTTVLVRTVNQPNELICTPDHEVWADSGDVQDWVHASYLAGTALASPSGFETVDGPYSDLSLDLQNALARLGKEETLAGLQFSARDRQTYLDIQLTAAQYGFSVNAYRSQDHSSINGVVVPALECHNGKVWTQVQKVYPYGVRHVWDLTVEEDSSFVCEGYVVHNSIGKALDVETPMLTSKGWTTMGELVEGDQLFTERGKLTTVTKAHKVLKNRECFSVTFSDDSSIVADADHLWTVYTYEDILHADRFGGNAAPQIKTTKEILDNLITTVRDDDTLELSELPTYRVPFVDKLDLSDVNLSNKDLHLAQSRLGGHIAREIVSVEPVKSRPVRCIEVDNATKIFLAGSSLVPTHNSMSIILRGLAFPFAYPGEEMVITAPEHIHLQAVWDKLEKATLSTRLSREFLKGKPQHRPYQLSFQNNARIMGRIPQKTGAGLQGMHPLVLELDEAGNFPESAWVEVRETLEDRPGATWRCIASGEQVLMSGYQWKAIEDVRVGDYVWTHNGSTQRVLNVFDNGEAECFRYSDDFHHTVLATDDHKFLVGDNVYTPISDAVFAPAQIMDTWYSYRGGVTPSASVITSKESVGRRRVYDLEVEGDHSYCVGGVFVSNCHGVSFGYGSTFNKLISGDDPHWTVRKLPSMNRPTWSDTVRQERIAAYGGYDSDGYRRNVLGLTSDPSGSPLFVMHRLYACVDSDAMSDYNTDEYYQPIIQEAQVRDIEAEGGGIEDLINIPVSHMAYKRVWIASDLGWTISPTSITVFAEVKNDEGKGALKLISRILLHKISAHDQMRVVMFLMDIYQPQCYALDATGAGFVLWDIMLEEMGKDPSTAWMRERVKDINFSSKVIVGFDNSVKVSPHEGLDGLMRSAIMQPFVVASTDQMRKLIDDGRMILPFDEDLLQELQDPTIKGNKISSLDAYGKSGRKKGMHNLDAMRMAVHSYESRELDLMMSSSKNAYAPPPIMFG